MYPALRRSTKLPQGADMPGKIPDLATVIPCHLFEPYGRTTVEMCPARRRAMSGPENVEPDPCRVCNFKTEE